MARHHKSKRGGHFHGTTGYHKDSVGHERTEGGMGLENHTGHANLPTDVKMMTYPNAYGDMPFGYYDDTMHGIDSQMKQDHSTAMKQFMPRKGF